MSWRHSGVFIVNSDFTYCSRVFIAGFEQVNAIICICRNRYANVDDNFTQFCCRLPVTLKNIKKGNEALLISSNHIIILKVSPSYCTKNTIIDLI